MENSGGLESCSGLRELSVRLPIPWEAPAELVLDDRGMIRDCNHAASSLFRLERKGMLWRHVSSFLPQLSDMDLMKGGEPAARLRFLCSIGHGFQALCGNGERFIAELFINNLDNAGPRHLRLIVRPA